MIVIRAFQLLLNVYLQSNLEVFLQNYQSIKISYSICLIVNQQYVMRQDISFHISKKDFLQKILQVFLQELRMGCFSHSLKRAERSKIYNVYLGGLAFQKHNNFLSNLGHCLNSGNSRSDFVGAQRVSNKSISFIISDCFKLSQSFTDTDIDFYQEVKNILLKFSYVSKEDLLPIINKYY